MFRRLALILFLLLAPGAAHATQWIATITGTTNAIDNDGLFGGPVGAYFASFAATYRYELGPETVETYPGGGFLLTRTLNMLEVTLSVGGGPAVQQTSPRIAWAEYFHDEDYNYIRLVSFVPGPTYPLEIGNYWGGPYFLSSAPPNSFNTPVDREFSGSHAQFGMDTIDYSTGEPEHYINYRFEVDNRPGRITIAQVVPEPSTWVLLIGGFMLAGAALRRRSSGDPRHDRASACAEARQISVG